MYNTYRQAHMEWRHELLKQGKQKEADEYGELSDQLVLLDFPITLDVSADPAAQKIKWVQIRLRIVEEYQTLISLLAPLVAYAALYFLVWHMAFLSVRYIKGDASTESNSK
jgi:hypothetical protein